MKKKISLIIICLTMSGSITGNSTVFAQEDYQTIMEDYKAVILLLDQINYQYDCALEAIGDCIDGKINLSEAEEKVNGTISALMEEKESYNFYYKSNRSSFISSSLHLRYAFVIRPLCLRFAFVMFSLR